MALSNFDFENKQFPSLNRNMHEIQEEINEQDETGGFMERDSNQTEDMNTLFLNEGIAAYSK